MFMNVLIMCACIAFFCWMISSILSSAFGGGMSTAAEKSKRNLQQNMKQIDRLKRIQRGEKVDDNEQ